LKGKLIYIYIYCPFFVPQYLDIFAAWRLEMGKDVGNPPLFVCIDNSVGFMYLYRYIYIGTFL